MKKQPWMVIDCMTYKMNDRQKTDGEFLQSRYFRPQTHTKQVPIQGFRILYRTAYRSPLLINNLLSRWTTKIISFKVTLRLLRSRFETRIIFSYRFLLSRLRIWGSTGVETTLPVRHLRLLLSLPVLRRWGHIRLVVTPTRPSFQIPIHEGLQTTSHRRPLGPGRPP